MPPLYVPPVLVPTPYLAPTGAAFETFPRSTYSNTTLSTTSGTLMMAAIALPAGFSVGKISFTSASVAASTPTHWWFGLYDSSRVQLATTADQTTTAWAATTAKTLAVATTAAGAASSFVTTYTGLYYVGFLMTATTNINLAPSAISIGIAGQTPVLSGTSSTSLLTPPAFPTTAGAILTLGNVAYAWVGN